MDTFDFNTGMHAIYDMKAGKWEERAPMPTPRSSHGGMIYRRQVLLRGRRGDSAGVWAE